MEMYKKIKGVISANTESFLCLMDRGVISTFRSHVMNTFHKTLAAMENNGSIGAEQSKLKTFWKGVIIVDDIKMIMNQGKRSKYHHP